MQPSGKSIHISWPSTRARHPERYRPRVEAHALTYLIIVPITRLAAVSSVFHRARCRRRVRVLSEEEKEWRLRRRSPSCISVRAKPHNQCHHARVDTGRVRHCSCRLCHMMCQEVLLLAAQLCLFRCSGGRWPGKRTWVPLM